MKLISNLFSIFTKTVYLTITALILGWVGLNVLEDFGHVYSMEAAFTVVFSALVLKKVFLSNQREVIKYVKEGDSFYSGLPFGESSFSLLYTISLNLSLLLAYLTYKIVMWIL